MNIIKIEVGKSYGEFTTNCYLITHNQKCIVVDPGDEAEKIISTIEENNLMPIQIILTHAHIDHIKESPYLSKHFNVEISICKNELPVLNDNSCNLSIFFGNPMPKINNLNLLNENDIISIDNEKLKIIETPGHTIGSIAIIGNDFIISGDTLFHESIGRTDLPTGNMNDILNSIKTKIFILPDNTKIYPGHMQETTISHEKKYNPFIQ